MYQFFLFSIKINFFLYYMQEYSDSRYSLNFVLYTGIRICNRKVP